MDPNAAIDELRQLCVNYHADDSSYYDGIDVGRMVELIEALDDWLIKGGFLPKEWER